MPAVEIADSIVQSGRETLEKVCVGVNASKVESLQPTLFLVIQAIAVIDTTEKWGARVVYGDTDSVFIYLKGKTKEQAFKIGYEIADTITAMNPPPIKLKFEKVGVTRGLHVSFSKTHGSGTGVLAMRAHCEEEIRRIQIRDTRRN